MTTTGDDISEALAALAKQQSKGGQSNLLDDLLDGLSGAVICPAPDGVPGWRAKPSVERFRNEEEGQAPTA